MKNNYNPYTVPENFFEESQKKAITGFRKRVRAVKCGIAALVAALIVFMIPIMTGQFAHPDEGEQVLAENELTEMYEYDIFLQVNF